MNISLTTELEEFVKMQVSSGHYTSASEVVREALRDKIQAHTMGQIRNRLEQSRQAVAEGRYVVADDAYFERKRQRIRDKFMTDPTAE